MQRILRRLKMLLLLSCWIIAGITAEDPPTRHYRRKNDSLCLYVGKSPPYHQATWLFNEEAVVLGEQVRPEYRYKVDYNPENLTLCINKLTEADSGIYKVTFFDFNYKESAETHILIVEETVPRPVIRMSVMHSNLSAGFCNITVNCSIEDDWMLSVCDEDICRTSQRSFRRVNITISADNRSIVCIGNNHVSKSNVSENLEATCFNKSKPEHEETSQPPILIVIVIGTVVCILCVLIVCVAKKHRLTENNHHQAQTSTVQLRQSQPAEAQPQLVPRASTSSSQADVSYENVEAPQPSQTSSPTISPREELGTEQSETVDTVYSFLQVPNGTTSPGSSDSSKDTKGHKTIGEASTSQPVTQDEAEHPAPVDTVYSVLQKPKNLKSQHHQQVEQDCQKPKR